MQGRLEVTQLPIVVGVRFKKAGKIYYFDPANFELVRGSKVVVETARGLEYGEVSIAPRDTDDEEIVQPLKPVVRIGTLRDADIAAENKRREKDAYAVAQGRIRAHGLDMNLVDVEYTFDNAKIVFYFTAEGRIDFRELVKDLAGIFRTRIEMRQIGVRDEAKLIGGIGPCGRILCCTSFLGDFAPVSIRMAKDQNLSLNPSKISGLCGRLMCCLRYEQDTYEAAKKDPTLAPGYAPPQLTEEVAHGLDELDEDFPGEGRGRGARIAAQITEAPLRPPQRREGSRPEERREAPREQPRDNMRERSLPRERPNQERDAGRNAGASPWKGPQRSVPQQASGVQPPAPVRLAPASGTRTPEVAASDTAGDAKRRRRRRRGTGGPNAAGEQAQQPRVVELGGRPSMRPLHLAPRDGVPHSATGASAGNAAALGDAAKRRRRKRRRNGSEASGAPTSDD